MPVHIIFVCHILNLTLTLTLPLTQGLNKPQLWANMGLIAREGEFDQKPHLVASLFIKGHLAQWVAHEAYNCPVSV